MRENDKVQQPLYFKRILAGVIILWRSLYFVTPDGLVNTAAERNAFVPYFNSVRQLISHNL
jgi:hypothetical protein